MWAPDQLEVNRAFAILAAERWGADAQSITHIGDFGNSVYSFDLAGATVILRLTDPIDRSHSATRAELDFIIYLKRCGVQVSTPIRSRRGDLIEVVSVGKVMLMASVFEFAPGTVITPESPAWDEAFFRTWGRTLAQIHQAACTFEPIGLSRRWHWFHEHLLANARRYLPSDDVVSLRELNTVLVHLQQLSVSRTNYGLIHADFGGSNFHYDAQHGITVFDFGNCCYHWFACDLAISISTLRFYPERDQYARCILAGYQSVYPLDPLFFTEFPLFLRLRILYVYLDRLVVFGATPTPPQRETLALLRGRVHEASTGAVWSLG